MHATYTFVAVLACAIVVLLATCSGDRVQLIELHGADGHRVFVNGREISTLREPTEADLNKYFAKGTRCIVVTGNGKFIAVAEACHTIRDLLSR